VDFLAGVGYNGWNLKPDQEGRITIKLADLGRSSLCAGAGGECGQCVVRDVSLADTQTKCAVWRFRNGLDPNGHFTRQNQITILEKDAPLTLKDGSNCAVSTAR